MPMRFNEIGLSGKLAGFNATPFRSAGQITDPFLRTYVIDLDNNASGAVQATGFIMPAHCVPLYGYVRNKVTGSATTVSVGTVGGAVTDLLNAGSVASTGNIPLAPSTSDIGGEEIEYQYNNPGDGEAELILAVIGSNT